ncbi:hypothetical protein BDP27DRAFT_1204815, partial [Rhodocollybia butyracea]
RRISRDLKICAINLYQRELLDLEDILDCVGFSERTFYRILALYRETGDVIRHHFGPIGHPHLLLYDDIDYLLCLVRHRPDYFLDELANLLEDNHFISIHFCTAMRQLQNCGISLKKLCRIAREH